MRLKLFFEKKKRHHFIYTAEKNSAYLQVITSYFELIKTVTRYDYISSLNNQHDRIKKELVGYNLKYWI